MNVILKKLVSLATLEWAAQLPISQLQLNYASDQLI